jgi:hypothetical protein
VAENMLDDSEKVIVEKMGPQLGPVFFALHKEVVWLHAKWQEYRELFGHSPERVELLNRSAAFFFRVIEDSLWEDVLLHISRLTDPSRTTGNENLSVQCLPPLVADLALRAHVGRLTAECVAKAAFAREHRNKRLAHADLAHTLNRKAIPLSGISRAHVEEMLLSFRELMNLVDNRYRDTTVAYEHFITNNGAPSLISRLQRFENLVAETPLSERAL